MYLLSSNFLTIASSVDGLDYSTAGLFICFSTLHIVGSFYLNFLRWVGIWMDHDLGRCRRCRCAWCACLEAYFISMGWQKQCYFRRTGSAELSKHRRNGLSHIFYIPCIEKTRLIFFCFTSTNGKLVVWVGVGCLDSWDSLMKGIGILRGTRFGFQITNLPLVDHNCSLLASLSTRQKSNIDTKNGNHLFQTIASPVGLCHDSLSLLLWWDQDIT